MSDGVDGVLVCLGILSVRSSGLSLFVIGDVKGRAGPRGQRRPRVRPMICLHTRIFSLICWLSRHRLWPSAVHAFMHYFEWDILAQYYVICSILGQTWLNGGANSTMFNIVTYVISCDVALLGLLESCTCDLLLFCCLLGKFCSFRMRGSL